MKAFRAIATWGPVVPTNSTTTACWDITGNVTNAGEIDVNFIASGGANGLAISSVAPAAKQRAGRH